MNYKEEFKLIFGEKETRLFFSPGRVNLIGEHIDYCGGNVFPFAINYGTYGVVAKRTDQKVRIFSGNFKELGIIECDLEHLEYKKEDDYVNYFKGMIKEIKDLNYEIDCGFDLYVSGNIPSGGGLSSSASVELLVGHILKSLYSLKISDLDLVKIAKKCENEYIGVNCGIMDQFAIGMAKVDYATLLNTANLDFEYVPFNLGDHVIVIGNTNKIRRLQESKYNERREETEIGLKIINQRIKVNNLCELSVDDVTLNKDLFDDVIFKRVMHVVSENKRVNDSVNALYNNDLITLGKLLNESHYSLKNNYEVTGIELDTIQELFIKYGALGARMTGAGFGGCAIALFKNENLSEKLKLINLEYKDKIGYEASFYLAKTSDGTKEL